MNRIPSRKYLIPIPLAFLCLGALFFLVRALTGGSGEDRRFEAAAADLFRQEITSTTMNLHYTLADPAGYGIEDYPITLGTVQTETPSSGGNVSPSGASANENASGDSADGLRAVLASADPSRLNKENSLIYQLLERELKLQEDAQELELLQEYLSPSLGVQAQLPVLLCEYAFRTKQDILDYLALLKEIPDYFARILEFEQEKAANGYFMNDLAADGVIAQCSSFIEDPENLCLDPVFRQKIEEFPDLTPEERSALLELHSRLIASCVIPAYQSLIDGLTRLKGSGQNTGGLANLEGGQEYYRWLLRSQVGTDDDPDAIRQRMIRQLLEDTEEMQLLLSADPSLLSETGAGMPSEDVTDEPAEILEELYEAVQEDFPELGQVEYEVKYVDESLEDFLSPAFYLTPPADTATPNAIYINQTASMEGIELYTTLAHEGFPGHLYQTVYFARTEPQMIRYLYEPSGYVEGWATYVESYAYSWAGGNASLNRLLWLNRSINLCIYSLMDIGIHYDGWSAEEAASFLGQFGVSDMSVVSEIYEYIVETPANYLKYYYGYLNFLDIRTDMEAMKGTDFSPKEFHRELLELGPLPFSLLREELGLPEAS